MSEEADGTTRSPKMTRNSSSRPTAGKTMPRRTCVACRQIKNKKELVRVVRTPEGEVEIDITGKKDGRGAYLCPVPECMEKALKGKQLERTLRTGIRNENRQRLIKYAKELSGGTD